LWGARRGGSGEGDFPDIQFFLSPMHPRFLNLYFHWLLF